jgi:hypothetical protein
VPGVPGLSRYRERRAGDALKKTGEPGEARPKIRARRSPSKKFYRFRLLCLSRGSRSTSGGEQPVAAHRSPRSRSCVSLPPRALGRPECIRMRATLRPYWLGRARMIAAGVRRRLPPGDLSALTSDPMSVPEQRPVRLGGALQRGAVLRCLVNTTPLKWRGRASLFTFERLSGRVASATSFSLGARARTIPASPASPESSSPDTRSRGRPGEAPLVRFCSPSAHVSHAACCLPVLPSTGRSRFGVVGRSCCTRLTPRTLAGPSALAVSRSEAATGPWMLRRKVPVNRGRRLVGSCVGRSSGPAFRYPYQRSRGPSGTFKRPGGALGVHPFAVLLLPARL